MHSSAQSVPRDRKERGGGRWSGKKRGVFNTSSKDGGNWKVKVCVCVGRDSKRLRHREEKYV